jgi:hypothetical protein
LHDRAEHLLFFGDREGKYFFVHMLSICDSHANAAMGYYPHSARDGPITSLKMPSGANWTGKEAHRNSQNSFF